MKNRVLQRNDEVGRQLLYVVVVVDGERAPADHAIDVVVVDVVVDVAAAGIATSDPPQLQYVVGLAYSEAVLRIEALLFTAPWETR